MNKSELSVDLSKVLNAHNVDTETDTPDFILSDMLVSHLETLIAFQEANERWHADDRVERREMDPKEREIAMEHLRSLPQAKTKKLVL